MIQVALSEDHIKWLQDGTCIQTPEYTDYILTEAVRKIGDKYYLIEHPVFKLKILAAAHAMALEFDAVPSREEVYSFVKDYDTPFPPNFYIQASDLYEGYSCSDLRSIMFDLIAEI